MSNQALCPEEDKENKKDRPLASGRISLESAKILRWALVPICWAMSYLYSVQTLYASIALSFLTMVYNEFGGHAGHWIVRNLSVAVCYGSFELGATLVACASPLLFPMILPDLTDIHQPFAAAKRETLDSIAIASICISSGILATTYHAQDLKDIHGDRIAGRRTLPIVSPVIAQNIEERQVYEVER